MCRGFTCCILVFVNIPFMLVGLAFTAAGGVALWGKDMMREFLQSFMSGGENSTEDKMNAVIEAFEKIIQPLGLFLFIGGLIIFVIALMAFIGLCCRVRIALIIYGVLVGILFLAHLIVIIIYFANPQIILQCMDKTLKSFIMEYESTLSTTPKSTMAQVIMLKLECCGYYNGEDFKDPGAKFTGRDEYKGHEFNNLEYPLPCCRTDSVGTSSKDCPQSFTPWTSNKDTGCKDKVDEVLLPLLDMVMKISIIALAIELLILIMVTINLCLTKK